MIGRLPLARPAAIVAATVVAALAVCAGALGAGGGLVLVANPKVDGLDGVDAQGLIPTVSDGGRYVGMIADSASTGTFVLLRDMESPNPITVTASTTASEEEGYDADSPGISADGRMLVFASEDPELSSEDRDFSGGGVTGITSPIRDIFVYDRVTKKITLVSRRDGVHGVAADDDSNLPSISADGRYVAFGTESRNLTAGKHYDGGAYVRDLVAHTTILASRLNGIHGKPVGGFEPSISQGGRLVAFVWSFGHGFSHRENEISVRYRKRAKTVMASVGNGRHGKPANDKCAEPSISANGRYVAFASKATNLVHGDNRKVEDVFVRDLKTNRTILVSRASGKHGAPGQGDSSRPAISANGRYVAFQSYANNLGPKDNAAALDVFVKDLKTGRVYLASAAPDGTPGNLDSASPGISPDGKFVVFNSKSTNLSPQDSDRKIGVFRYRIP